MNIDWRRGLRRYQRRFGWWLDAASLSLLLTTALAATYAAYRFFGHIRGGLAHVNVVTSMFFGGMIGSSTADLAGTGSIVIPAMKENGYPADFSAAVTAWARATMWSLGVNHGSDRTGWPPSNTRHFPAS